MLSWIFFGKTIFVWNRGKEKYSNGEVDVGFTDSCTTLCAFRSFHFWCHSALTTVRIVNRDDGMITSWRDVGGDNNAINQEGALLLQAHVNTLIMTSAHGPHVLRHHVACTTPGGQARQWDFMRRHACMIMYGWPWIHEHHRISQIMKNDQESSQFDTRQR